TAWASIGGWITSGRAYMPSVTARQRLIEVLDEVGGILDTDRKAQEIGRGRGAGALDRGAVLDQAFDAAQRGRPFPQPDARGSGDRGRLAAGDADAQHAAEAAGHLARRYGVAGMPRQARIEDAGDARMVGEMRRHGSGRAAGAFDAQIQRTHPAQQQPRLERTEDRAIA